MIDKSKSSDIVLIIPCYNESGNIGPLLNDIRSFGEDYDTVVIDDGSTDSTVDEASAFSPTVRMIRNLGIGGAVQTGIKYAYERGYSFCIQIDGDGQHLPNQIPILTSEQRLSGANIVIGSRFITDGDFRSTGFRRAGIRLISQTIKSLFKVTVTDPTSGMRLMDRKAMELFANDYPSDFPEPISIAKALKKGLCVTEVPVKMKARVFGSSSITGIKTLAYMIRVVGYILLIRLGD